jgi:hypothetical protein
MWTGAERLSSRAAWPGQKGRAWTILLPWSALWVALMPHPVWVALS